MVKGNPLGQGVQQNRVWGPWNAQQLLNQPCPACLACGGTGHRHQPALRYSQLLCHVLSHLLTQLHTRSKTMLALKIFPGFLGSKTTLNLESPLMPLLPCAEPPCHTTAQAAKDSAYQQRLITCANQSYDSHMIPWSMLLKKTFLARRWSCWAMTRFCDLHVLNTNMGLCTHIYTCAHTRTHLSSAYEQPLHTPAKTRNTR